MAAPFRVSAEELRRRIEAGERIAEIARAEGVHSNTVSRAAKVAGIEVPLARGPRATLPPIERVIIELRGGETPTTLGRKYGTTHSAVVKFLQRNFFAYGDRRVQYNAGPAWGDTTIQQRCMRIEDIERRIGRIRTGELVL